MAENRPRSVANHSFCPCVGLEDRLKQEFSEAIASVEKEFREMWGIEPVKRRRTVLYLRGMAQCYFKERRELKEWQAYIVSFIANVDKKIDRTLNLLLKIAPDHREEIYEIYR